LDSGEDHTLLEIQNVIHDAAKEDIEKPEPEQDENHGEDLRPWSQRSDVSVTDCTHGDDAEIERVDYGMSLDSGVVISIEGID
jgi:hypothetical protein